MLVCRQFCDLGLGRSRRGSGGSAGMMSQNDRSDQVRRLTFLMNLNATGIVSVQEIELKPALSQCPWASILLIAASRFVFIGRHRQVFLRRPFEPYDFNSFLVDPLEIFWLESV